MKKSIAIILLIFSTEILAIGYYDWQSNIDESCQPTISGKVKSIFSAYDFWLKTSVSMGMWAEFTNQERPQDDCIYLNSTQKNNCLIYVKSKWDWYRKCKPLVDANLRLTGK